MIVFRPVDYLVQNSSPDLEAMIELLEFDVLWTMAKHNRAQLRRSLRGVNVRLESVPQGITPEG